MKKEDFRTLLMGAKKTNMNKSTKTAGMKSSLA